MNLKALASIALFGLSLTATAELRLPNILSSHAVLQRDRPVRVWGWSSPQENVTVRFHEQIITTKADTLGQWEAWLRPESAGGPYMLTVSGDASKNKLERNDLLVGDVWFASGQSNMEMPLEGFNDQMRVKDGDKEIAGANQPRIRLLLQKKGTSPTPQTDILETWTECTPETARKFSAVAYFFGRELQQREHVPIGLIDATWGGTPAHSWISAEAIAANNLVSVFNDAVAINRDQAHVEAVQASYDREDAELKAAGKPVPAHPYIPGGNVVGWTPSGIFNHMVAPDVRYAIKGVIWYQGETDSDAQRASYYWRVFPTLISDWRHQWAQGDFPFLFVQISSYKSNGGWGTVRDAQRRTLSLRNTAMAVTLDVGAPTNVHPPDKQTVAARLALAARAIVYGEKVEYLSPAFVQTTTEPGALRVWFTNAAGLTSRGQPVGGFEVAGDDHKFQPATAQIEKLGDALTVLVTSPQVPSPRFVRYAWDGYVPTYLYNDAGLPAGTFSSE
jgi:sialate O-acetylesterase